MKTILIAIFLCHGLVGLSQAKNKPNKQSSIETSYDIWIGKIPQIGNGKPQFEPIQDSTRVTDHTLKTAIISLIQNIKKTGTADISKCFIPRDAIVVNLKNQHLYTLYICFECDGFRIKGKGYSDSGKTPNEKKRLQQIETAKKILEKVRQ